MINAPKVIWMNECNFDEQEYWDSPPETRPRGYSRDAIRHILMCGGCQTQDV